MELLEDRLAPAVFVVDRLTDNNAAGGEGTGNTGDLRYAVTQANLAADADTIVFDAALFAAGDATVTLQQFDNGHDSDEFGPSALRIRSDVTIQGPTGPNGVTIQRDSADADLFRLFYVHNEASDIRFRLENVTLRGGFAKGGNGTNGGGGAAGMGGGLFNRGESVELVNVLMRDHRALGGNGTASAGLGGGGGGVGEDGGGGVGGNPNRGSVFTPAGFGGGGGVNILTAGGEEGLPGGFGGGGGGSRFAGRGGFGGGGGGGAIAGGGGQGGLPGFGGGRGFNGGGGGAGMGAALFNFQGTVVLTNSTFSANRATGGTSFDGFGGSGFGAGVFNYNGTLNVLHATFADNVVAGGTGVDVDSSGTADGAALFSVADGATATVSLDNALLANSTGGRDFFRDAINGGTSNAAAGLRNLIENNATGANAYTGGVAATADPNLLPLADNGGPTFTHALDPQSVAVNAGGNAAAAGIANDQRGPGFARLQDGTVDIGAFEVTAPDFFVVDILDDEDDGNVQPGDLSLREAIRLANADLNFSTILFAPSLVAAGDATITLTQFDTGLNSDEFGPSALRVSSNVTLQGPSGPNGILLRRDVADTDRFRLFYVYQPLTRVTFRLENITLRGGLAQGGAGGSFGGGAAGMGGALFNRGEQVSLVGVLLTGNQAQGGKGFDGRGAIAGGGGVGAEGGTGGNLDGGGPNAGIFSPYAGPGFGGGGSLADNGGYGGGGGGSPGTAGRGGFGGGGGGFDSGGGGVGGFGGGSGGVFSGGGGAGMGAAIFNYHGMVSLTNTTVSGNTATGGGASQDTATKGSGFGAGVFNYNGTLTVLNSTFANNTVAAGAGTGRDGSANGAAIFSYGDENSPDGNVTATVTLNNTILANSTGGTSFFHDRSASGSSTASAGVANLIMNNAGGGNAYTGGIASTADPSLGMLADNGGPTFTHAITGGPAFNTGNPAAAAALTSDQRNFTPRAVGTVDIGAFEAGAAPQPQVLQITSNLPLLTNAQVGAGNFMLTVVFDVSMNTAVAPVFSFPVEMPGSALTFAGGQWTTTTAVNDTYVATFNVANLNLTLPAIDVRVTGGQESLGINAHGQTDRANLFGIDMTDVGGRTVTAAIQPILFNRGSRTLVFRVTFDRPVTGLSVANFRMLTTGGLRARLRRIQGGGTSYLVLVKVSTGVGTVQLGLALPGGDSRLSDAVLFNQVFRGARVRFLPQLPRL